MANHMAEVAKMFGVELGERFKLVDADFQYAFDYYLSEDGIKIDKEGTVCNQDLLKDLICGEYSIKRKPWKPKYGDAYFYVDNNGFIRKGLWYKNIYPIMYDKTLYKLGNCYRTKEDAEANKDKWIKFYESDEVLEV